MVVTQGNVSLEYGVLGAIVIDPALTSHDIFSRVKQEYFTDGSCRHLFETAREMYLNGDTIDALTVCTRAGEEKYRQLLMEIIQVTPSAANYEEYITLLEQESKRREAGQIGMKLYELSLAGASIPALQEQAEKLADIMAGETERHSHNMQDLLVDFFSRLGQKRTYLDWGYDKMNQKLFSEPGDYIVIGARPSVGKTAFALNLAAHMAKKHKVTFFSFETDKSKVIDRMMAAASSVSFTKIKKGETDTKEIEFLTYKKNSMLHLSFNFVAASGFTAEDIRAETLRSKSEIIIIDYIGLIDHSNKRLDEYAITTANSKALQRLARTTGTYVIALSQLNRGGDGMKALRGSGQIEQDADVIMLLEHAEENENENDEARADKDKRRVLRITKNKEGICGKLKMWFDGDTQHFMQEWQGFYQSKLEPMTELPRMKKPAPEEPAQVVIAD